MTDDLTRKFQSLLRELFQFEVADLDTGMYRILNLRRDQVRRFIDVTLPQKIDEQFPAGETDDRSDRAEVYSHLIEFFSRYYDAGDFMSQRRQSSRQKYSVPYQGEEVLLHWANRDQYYVKTGRKLKRLAVRDPAERFTLEFTVVESSEPQNNVVGENTYFQLYRGDEPIAWDLEAGVLRVQFELHGISSSEEKERGGKGTKAQDALIGSAEDAILERARQEDAGLHAWLTSPKQEWYGKEESRPTVIRAALRRYVREGKEDFFIHKRLGAFLREELDFYLKNEVFMLDNLVTAEEADLAPALARARAIKTVALEIIAFLDQLESFQKMLFEKKKFVVQCEYCLTLGRVPARFYSEIAANDRQVAEWRTLFVIGEREQKTLLQEQIDAAYLEANPYLILDTRFFDEAFKDRLLASYDDLDDAISGLMVKSENWQALNLLQELYKERVKCIYIDPPYNTGNDEFLYKDGYCHSSWLTNLQSRIELAKNFLLDKEGIVACSIDKNEMFRAKLLFDSIFGEESFVNSIVNVNNPKGRSDQKHIPTAHENLLFYAQDHAVTYGWQPEEKVTKRYSKQLNGGDKYREIDLRKTGDADSRADRPKMYYPFYFNPKTGDFFPSNEVIESSEYEPILPIRDDGSDGRWRWGIDTSSQNIDRLRPKYMPIKKKWTVIEIDILDDAERVMPTSVWGEKRFNSERATESFVNLGFRKEDFPRPKTVGLMHSLFLHTTGPTDTILDFFAGSGTTAHGLINLNRDSGENRRYILIEMGRHFDTVMKIRIHKVVYSSVWKDGISQDTNGINHIFKYITLEQYEDTLNNIELADRGSVQRTLFGMEDYLLSYFLDAESRDSPCRLSDPLLTRPFDYTLRVAKETLVNADDRGSGTEEDLPVRVDLVETFNYLLGLHVVKRLAYHENGTRYVAVLGRQGYEHVVVIWRTAEGLDLAADRSFIESRILPDLRAAIGVPGAREHRLFVNADCIIKDAEPIGPTFRRLMGA